jgi:hypothetical protein
LSGRVERRAAAAEKWIMSSKPRRVSPATVISIIALVFALSGTAMAAKRYLITNAKQISPAALKQIAKLAKDGAAGPSGAAGANGVNGAPGAAGAEGAEGKSGLRGERGPGATVYWAVVSASGEVKRHGSGDTTASKLAIGTYEVKFDEPVEECAYEAAIGRYDTQSTEDPGFATVVARNEEIDAVLIQTYDVEGNGVDKNFHLAVFCNNEES